MHQAKHLRLFVGTVLFAALLLGVQSASADTVTTTVGVGTSPQAVAVNPVTNKIYVANQSSNNVTVIDGATNSTTTVGAGTDPRAVAVNPVTSKIYVANENSANVTVIDGATNSTATVSAGSSPRAVAVNPVTNKTAPQLAFRPGCSPPPACSPAAGSRSAHRPAQWAWARVAAEAMASALLALSDPERQSKDEGLPPLAEARLAFAIQTTADKARTLSVGKFVTGCPLGRLVAPNLTSEVTV